MGEHWKLSKDIGNVAVLTFDRTDKEMNVLSENICEELSGLLDEIAKDTSTEGLVIESGKKDFIAGADITEFKGMKTAEAATEASARLQALFEKLANLKCPTVAAISGQALGGEKKTTRDRRKNQY